MWYVSMNQLIVLVFRRCAYAITVSICILINPCLFLYLTHVKGTEREILTKSLHCTPLRTLVLK